MSPREVRHRLVAGVDIGGTFTDVAAIDPRTGEVSTAKVPTTPGHLEEGVAEGLRTLPPRRVGEVRHGTTIVTNALLEGRVARTALLCTRGFRDVLEMRRLWREKLFGYDWERPEALIPRDLRLEVDERVGPRGEVIRPLDEGQVRRYAGFLRDRGIEAIAVAYLFSFRNPTHERRTRDLLVEELPGVSVSISSEVLPEVHEYERTSTTVINAQVRPAVERYLSRLDRVLGDVGAAGPLRIVRSDGSLITPSVAAREPFRLVHSGPAAGVTGAAKLCGWLGWKNVVTLDMGGTSTDVSLVWEGEPLRIFESDVRWNVPIRATQIDIQSIGAGGGSIVRTEAAGRLLVGPESAGADPGPACYGRGGDRATLTDALLVLGMLPDALLGGALPLRRSVAERALRTALPEFIDPREAAAAVYTVTLHKMAVLTREVTVNRGYDPRDCVLVCFGGAGGLFAVDLARELGMTGVYVPPAASVFSALGAALSRLSYEAIEGVFAKVEGVDVDALDWSVRSLAARAEGRLREEGVRVVGTVLEVDLKYRAQPETLTVPLAAAGGIRDGLARAVEEFHDLHARRFGLRREGEPVDLVTLRAIAWGPDPEASVVKVPRVPGGGDLEPRTWFRDGKEIRDVPVVALGALDDVDGPAFVQDAVTTIAVPPGSSARLDELGGVLLEVGA
ncbi:MAG TPA: hydantoinase/oxoprolinase family protein [Actinomycetota bacterium]|nr:hydantoinase/oxoprolinase family protein [Actinomycetota bacterium]